MLQHNAKIWESAFADDNVRSQNRFSEYKRHMGVFLNAGFTHVLNLADRQRNPIENEAPNFLPEHIEYKGICIDDSLSFDISQYFDETNAFIQSAIDLNGKNSEVHVQ